MLIEHRGGRPRIDPASRIAPNAVIAGDVEIGANCSIGYGAIVVAESGPIRIGANCVIMDTAVIRAVKTHPVTIGNNVMIGARACLVGCTVEDEAFLATGATVFNGARIGKGAEVRINGLVHLRTRLADGATVPIGWVAVGDPAEILPPDRHDEIWAIQKTLDFPGTVFGVGRPPPGETFMSDVMPRYAAALRRWHADDREIDPNSAA